MDLGILWSANLSEMAMPGFYVGAGDLNSDPLVYIASNLTHYIFQTSSYFLPFTVCRGHSAVEMTFEFAGE